MPDDDLPHTLLQAYLQPLTNLLFPLSGNDKMTAWDNAIDATNSLNPKTATEFRLAVRVCVFNIRANQFTAQAAQPGLPPSVAIRMSQCALAYARDADKAERQLEKRQAARIKEQQQEPKAPEVEPAPVEETTAPPLEAEASETQTPEIETPEARPIPAYKLLKQARREARKRDHQARFQAQALAATQEDPDIPLAA